MLFAQTLEHDHRSWIGRRVILKTMSHDSSGRGAVPLTRREMLARSGAGIGALALAQLLGAPSPATANTAAGEPPLAPRAPHFTPKAKRFVHLFANGGPSQVDTFDPAAAREVSRQTHPARRHRGRARRAGQRQSGLRLEASISTARSQRHRSQRVVPRDRPAHRRPLRRALDARGRHLARRRHHVHEHRRGASEPAQPRLVGDDGLGSENRDLPGFIALCPDGYPLNETQNWQSAFLPGAYQGTFVNTKFEDVERLIENIRNRRVAPAEQRAQLDLLGRLNRLHQQTRADEGRLESRIQSFEQAFRMQVEATDAFDLAREPKSVLDAYGPARRRGSSS